MTSTMLLRLSRCRARWHCAVSSSDTTDATRPQGLDTVVLQTGCCFGNKPGAELWTFRMGNKRPVLGIRARNWGWCRLSIWSGLEGVMTNISWGSDMESGGLTSFCNFSCRAEAAEPSSHPGSPEHHNQSGEVGRAHQDAEQHKCPQPIGKNNIHWAAVILYTQTT